MGFMPSSWLPLRFGRKAGKNPLNELVSRIIGLWHSRPSVDYSRNDYDLWRALFYCSQYGGKGHEYVRGAGTAKAIINATAAFAIGNGFAAAVDGADQVATHQSVEERLQTWIEEHDSEIYDIAKFAYRDGDSFSLVREDGSIEDLDPDTVDIIFQPLTGKLLGYDITETNQEDDRTVTYIRQFRTTGVKYLRLEAGQKLEDAEVLYEVYHTDDGLFTPEPDSVDLTWTESVVEMPLPVIHYANEPERKALYGNSELQNVLIFYKDYNDVLEGAVKNDVYNNMPIPYFTGIQKPPTDLSRDTAIAIPDAQARLATCRRTKQPRTP